MEENKTLNQKLNNEAGFTLIELIIVILLVGILSSIAAPSWLAFVNRQRVGKVNERVLSVIQEAQRQAKNKKLSYSVSFRMNGNDPQAAVHQAKDNQGNAQTPETFQWQSLVGDLGVKPEQVLVRTNLTGDNKSGATLSGLSEDKKITFDNQGVLDDPDIGNGLAIVVAVPNSKDKDNPIESTKRCVIVKTILGALETDRKGGCPSST
ncbi:prepilin-type N-terminal cleavage/methylation domain-containing protein [Moorena producens JHB]|uniref:Prepilin-type N-terminal cleavage/methylation domain-containing protein n=1 Tax=Moorena producens (strain JHB) TaxID=1454205 RepID=A0A1D9G807_MOOP1|nr:prepilin-type N-terminal cleavage/methylation domain-containing protein [Moorena producens]AOY83674.1 prepilin-type N-terminal cleavage/methylation domain-containing protein [Moorena producens JHB]